MADAPEDVQEQGGEAPAKGGPLPYIIVGILGTGLGLAVAFLLPSDAMVSSNSADAGVLRPELSPDAPMAYLPLSTEAMVINIAGDRMSRYLSLSIILQVEKTQKDKIQLILDDKGILLKNWLFSHISGKTLEDLAGTAGMNRLRREIRDEFNTQLFPDGYDRIYDILFDEFAIQ